MGTHTLYRPVGQKELDLIEQAGWRRFPPRLDWQPILEQFNDHIRGAIEVIAESRGQPPQRIR